MPARRSSPDPDRTFQLLERALTPVIEERLQSEFGEGWTVATSAEPAGDSVLWTLPSLLETVQGNGSLFPATLRDPVKPLLRLYSKRQRLSAKEGQELAHRVRGLLAEFSPALAAELEAELPGGEAIAEDTTGGEQELGIEEEPEVEEETTAADELPVDQVAQPALGLMSNPSPPHAGEAREGPGQEPGDNRETDQAGVHRDEVADGAEKKQSRWIDAFTCLIAIAMVGGIVALWTTNRNTPSDAPAPAGERRSAGRVPGIDIILYGHVGLYSDEIALCGGYDQQSGEWMLPEHGWEQTTWLCFDLEHEKPLTLVSDTLYTGHPKTPELFLELKTPSSKGVVVAGLRNPRPRTPQRDYPSESEKEALEEETRRLLRDKRFPETTGISLGLAYKVDLDGDGDDEEVWAARSRAGGPHDTDAPWSSEVDMRPDDYALVAVRYINSQGDRVAKIVDLYDKETSESLPAASQAPRFDLQSPVDVTGDGKMEIVFYKQYSTTHEFHLTEFDGSSRETNKGPVRTGRRR